MPKWNLLWSFFRKWEFPSSPQAKSSQLFELSSWVFFFKVIYQGTGQPLEHEVRAQTTSATALRQKYCSLPFSSKSIFSVESSQNRSFHSSPILRLPHQLTLYFPYWSLTSVMPGWHSISAYAAVEGHRECYRGEKSTSRSLSRLREPLLDGTAGPSWSQALEGDLEHAEEGILKHGFSKVQGPGFPRSRGMLGYKNNI